MKIVERSLISVPPEKVWPFIVTPELFWQWNDKIVSMEARGAFVAGQRFSTRYRLTSQSAQCLSVVAELQPLRVLELRHRVVMSASGRTGVNAAERITLEEKNGGTLVTKTVTIGRHGIPLWLLPVIWFVTRFGKPAGEDRLKTLCETGDPVRGAGRRSA